MEQQYADFFSVHQIDLLSRTIYRDFLAKYPYRFTKDYISYETFALVFGVILMGARTLTAPDMITHHISRQVDRFDHSNTPIYSLDRPTFDLFSDSSIANVDDLFAGANSDGKPSHYCILLPKGSFITEDGASIEVLWIESFHNNSDSEMESRLIVVKKGVYGQKLAVGSTVVDTGAVDTSGTLWGSRRVYPKPVDAQMQNLGGDETSARDDEILDRLQNISLQIIMSIEYLSSQAIEIVAPTSERRGFGKSAPETTVWHPRKLSIERKRYLKTDTGDGSPDSEKSRNSPRPHWRKFHWRRVATGPGRLQREFRLIQRTYVSSNYTAESTSPTQK